VGLQPRGAEEGLHALAKAFALHFVKPSFPFVALFYLFALDHFHLFQTL
jgi:hypothetical protein